MDTLALQKLISEGEGQHLDFKRRVPCSYKIARTIVSMANASGGSILVGVEDNGNIAGIYPEEERFMILKACTDYCLPAISPTLHIIRLEDDLEVLRIDIEESKDKPHTAIGKDGKEHVYVRSKDESRKATQEELNYFNGLKEAEAVFHDTTNNELALFFYLENRSKITIKEYAKLINSSRNKARHILERLAQFGYLIRRNQATFISA